MHTNVFASVSICHSYTFQTDSLFLPLEGKAVSFYHSTRLRHLRFVGSIDKSGYAIGPFWISGFRTTLNPFTNGFKYGLLDQHGALSGMVSWVKANGGLLQSQLLRAISTFVGNHSAFVFPDMKTVYYGTFQGNTMMHAQETVIAAERCRNGIKELAVSGRVTQVLL